MRCQTKPDDLIDKTIEHQLEVRRPPTPGANLTKNGNRGVISWVLKGEPLVKLDFMGQTQLKDSC